MTPGVIEKLYSVYAFVFHISRLLFHWLFELLNKNDVYNDKVGAIIIGSGHLALGFDIVCRSSYLLVRKRLYHIQAFSRADRP